MDTKSLLIGALVVVAATLGYLVYQNQRQTVQIQLPSIKINPQ